MVVEVELDKLHKALEVVPVLVQAWSAVVAVLERKSDMVD